MSILKTISIITLSIMLIIELYCFIKDLKNQKTFGTILVWIIMIAFTFVPYLYIVLR